MQAVQEVTVWTGCTQQPNHIYLLDGSQAIAYMAFGTAEPKYFKRPLRLDLRGRRFVPADSALFTAKPSRQSRLIQVAGSKGAEYTVDLDSETCTCPGYQFRGRCRHLSELIDQKK
jgi:hypothetical protein